MIFVQFLFIFLFNFSLIFIYIQTGAKQQNQLQQMTAGMMMQNQRAMVNTFFFIQFPCDIQLLRQNHTNCIFFLKAGRTIQRRRMTTVGMMNRPQKVQVNALPKLSQR